MAAGGGCQRIVLFGLHGPLPTHRVCACVTLCLFIWHPSELCKNGGTSCDAF